MRTRLLALPTLVLLAPVLVGCGEQGTDAASDTGSDTGSDVETTDCSYPEAGEPAVEGVEPPSEQAPAEGEVPVTLSTSVGDLELSLDAATTPCTVHSFVSLAEQKYFDGTTCHRLVTAGIYVLQCGDPTGTGMGGPGYSFDDELTGQEDYSAGALAMANSGPDTNGSQFFIVYGDSTGLPKDYTVFGSVDVASVSTIEEVAAEGSTPPNDGAPNTKVAIESATVGDQG
jgi:peptidyl-prolyl cis-trans isomerase B (cyclophilin B)